MPEEFKFDDYQSRLKQEFQIELEPGNWVAAELVEATEHQYADDIAGEAPRSSFSILFLVESDFQLHQRMYNVKQEELGETQIFLVPQQPDVNGTRLEAIFT